MAQILPRVGRHPSPLVSFYSVQRYLRCDMSIIDYFYRCNFCRCDLELVPFSILRIPAMLAGLLGMRVHQCPHCFGCVFRPYLPVPLLRLFRTPQKPDATDKAEREDRLSNARMHPEIVREIAAEPGAPDQPDQIRLAPDSAGPNDSTIRTMPERDGPYVGGRS